MSRIKSKLMLDEDNKYNMIWNEISIQIPCHVLIHKWNIFNGMFHGANIIIVVHIFKFAKSSTSSSKGISVWASLRCSMFQLISPIDHVIKKEQSQLLIFLDSIDGSAKVVRFTTFYTHVLIFTSVMSRQRTTLTWDEDNKYNMF